MIVQDHSWSALQDTIINCRKCPRLVAWREQVAVTRRRAYREEEYWGKPVTGFGDRGGRVLVIGLAPGAHGANRTGRVFTGDGSGKFLFRALHRAGFANQPESTHLRDGLALNDVYISAVCRCAPPQNKPEPQEIENCLPYLSAEMELMENRKVLVTLGKIAFDNTLRLLRQTGNIRPRLDFAHGAIYKVDEKPVWLVASYHPSLQNTQTGRLTEPMFDEVWENVIRLLE